MKFGFLPVGHTHEDVVSCISRHLKHRNALTVPGTYMSMFCFYLLFLELASVIRDSFTPEPEVMVLESVTDTKQWMHEQTPPMHDHLKVHQFKFQLDKQGQCRMFYKEWTTDDFWLPQSGLTMTIHWLLGHAMIQLPWRSWRLHWERSVHIWIRLVYQHGGYHG